MRLRWWILGVLTSCMLVGQTRPVHAAGPDTYQIGVAKIDITPDYPIRLSGFGFRRTESEGVTQRIWAKALVIDDGEPAVLVTIDTCIIPFELTKELAARLERKTKLRPERLAVTITHTHTAPMIKGTVPTLFGVPIPKEHQDRIDRYSAELLDKLEQVCLTALADRKPAKLSWGVGSVDFAMNRRTKGGPVDHDLPVLVVKDLQGNVRVIWTSYACHCVTLSNNKISGDWAGYAQEAIQDALPGAIALVSIGCGADQNPNSGVTGDKWEIAQRQGADVAKEVKRVLATPLKPISGRLTCATDEFELPLATLPTKADWEERAKRNDAIGHHARVQLKRLESDQRLKAEIPYLVQSWAFGESLALAFLPGEVVVDYSLRLKRELDRQRLWINAYSNGCPCYIPSERVLKEGGYEGGGAMTYYDLPAPLKFGLEDKIIQSVNGQLGAKFKSPIDSDKTGGTRPLSPQQSLKLIQTRKDLAVELMAAEPLVTSPVAIDWGPDGRLYVAEMFDYPEGLNRDFQPGGRIRVLQSTHRDWHYDKATVFLDNIPFPTGVTAYRKGVLVCAAPDILYAEDTDGDGKADVVKKLYSGFGTHNYQGRVNSLEYGLDGWIYGSCGIFGGTITCRPLFPPHPNPLPPGGEGGKSALLSPKGGEGSGVRGERVVQLGDRDFRIKPDEGLMEPATGRTQQGRVRDDWGNWFGCDSGQLCRHYPLMDHYLRRNPHYAPSETAVYVPQDQKLFPLRQELQLFKLSGPPGVPTAACGLGIYRDSLLGDDYYGNAFVCEPVNLLVHRMKLLPKGSTFVGVRAEDEQQSEFLASTDPWFRPVQARTGPDGCLWIVDMYRYVIEHPRWIPPEDLAKLDLRAGSTMGRIYRVRPKDKAPRSMTDKIVAINSGNGWQRDMAMHELPYRYAETPEEHKKAVHDLLERMAGNTQPQTRVQVLCALHEIGALRAELLLKALRDPHPGVRRQAVRLCENSEGLRPPLAEKLLKLVDDSDSQVRLQLACTLGQWKDVRAGKALAQLAVKHADDLHLLAAVLSGIHKDNIREVLASVFEKTAPPERLVRPLLTMAVRQGDDQVWGDAFDKIVSARKFEPWHFRAVAAILEAFERRQQKLETAFTAHRLRVLRNALGQASIHASLLDEKVDMRLAVIDVLGRDSEDRAADARLLINLADPDHVPEVQSAAVAALARIPDDMVAAELIRVWSTLTPTVKSQALDVLLSRPAWQKGLLAAIEKKEMPAPEIDATRRQRLLNHKEEAIRSLAARVFDGAVNADRQRVIDQFQEVATLKGDAARGKQVFAKTCSSCHLLDGVGHDVGPNLAALQNKSTAYLLQEVLDPNKNLDSRYAEYIVLTKAGRTLTGLLASETATCLTLRGQEMKQETILRTDIEELKSTGKSLMPEGLEKDLSKQDLADLFAYLGQDQRASPPGANAPGSPEPAEIAKQILDDKLPNEKRQALINQHPKLAAELVAAMTADLQPGTPEEYRRIPWIWRVSIAAGRRNDAQELVKLLEASLPKMGEPLRDWQAVVIGGGIINGISLQGQWPSARIAEILRERARLQERWEAILPQAHAMADKEKTPTGTRYDALRIIPLDAWEKCGERLTKYLAKGTHDELTMGAISGLSDVDRTEVAGLLLEHLEHFSAGNRKLAVEALLRTETRTTALLDALEKGEAKAAWLSAEQTKALRTHKNEAIRKRVEKMLPEK